MIVSTIQSIVNNLSKPCGFFYANTYEANFDLDQYNGGQDTVFVYTPPLDNTDTIDENGGIHTTFTLIFFMMKKLEHSTMDYKSIEVDSVIDEMRELAREFIHSLNADDIVEKGGVATGINSIKYQSEYAWQDIHLFGVSVTCEVPIYEGKTGCVS